MFRPSCICHQLKVERLHGLDTDMISADGSSSRAGEYRVQYEVGKPTC